MNNERHGARNAPIKPTLCAIHYALGEDRKCYREAVGCSSAVAKGIVPILPDLFGWGNYYRTEKDILDLGLTAGKKSLEESGIDRRAISAVLFCCVRFEKDEGDFAAMVSNLIRNLDISRAVPIGVTLNNCMSLLSAISLANCMVESGRYHSVLIISADKVRDESSRLSPFALLSDMAVSCVITRQTVPGFSVLACSILPSNVDDLEYNSISDELVYRQVAEELVLMSGVSLSEIRQFFGSNVFKPITLAKEGRLGIRPEQCYLDNVERKGHGFAGDTLISLMDYIRDNGVREGDKFALSTDAPNLRGSIFIEYRGSELSPLECGASSFHLSVDGDT
jgi:3-oxoacyl-[acyl-carrier-protein] synthase-3